MLSAMTMKILFPAIGGWIGFKFTQRGVREKTIGAIVGGIISIAVYIIIRLMDRFLFV